jgi:hypothetical protein
MHMNGLMDLVTKNLGADGLAGIAGALGIGSEQSSGLVTTAVSVLTGALAKNASEPEGAAALDAALERDHDGSVFSNLGALVGDIGGGPGAGILRHVLGEQRPQVEAEIAKKSGLDLSKVGGLLETVAPLVMGALGQKKREEGLSATDLAGMLAGERRQLEEKDDGLLGSVLGMLGGAGGGGGATAAPSSGGGLLSKVTGMLGGLFKKRG